MQPSTAAGPGGSAPVLPDAVPDGVQNLLNGIFGGITGVADAFGAAVSDLASAIGGSGGAAIIDLAGVVL